MKNSLRLIAAAALIGCTTGAFATSFVYTTDLSVRATGATSDGTSDISNSFKDDKIVLEARDDAATFVASQGRFAVRTWKPPSPTSAASCRPWPPTTSSWPRPS